MRLERDKFMTAEARYTERARVLEGVNCENKQLISNNAALLTNAYADARAQLLSELDEKFDKRAALLTNAYAEAHAQLLSELDKRLPSEPQATTETEFVPESGLRDTADDPDTAQAESSRKVMPIGIWFCSLLHTPGSHCRFCLLQRKRENEGCVEAASAGL